MSCNLRVVKMRKLQDLAEYGKKMPDPVINFAPGSVCKPASQRRAARARKETNGRSFA